jgi:Domain of unknown function (DUF4136)
MKTIALALLASTAFACTPAIHAGPAVQSVAASSAPLAQYRTFSLGLTEDPPAGFQVSPRALEVEHRMRDLVGSALEHKGYVEANAKPDFLVRFAAGTVRVDPGPATEENTDATPYTLRKIDIDVYDTSTKTEVWQGTATSEVGVNKYIDKSLLQRDVQGALATFPVRRAPASEPVTNPIAAGESNAAGGQ